MVYLIGSLRNPEIPSVATAIRGVGIEVFDDWYAAGTEADDKWRDYEIQRGRSYLEALQGKAATHVYEFDLSNLQAASVAVLVLPAGKSGHLELGWFLGHGRPGYILLDNPDRWDVMYKFATGVYEKLEDLIDRLAHDVPNSMLPGLCVPRNGEDNQAQVLTGSIHLAGDPYPWSLFPNSGDVFSGCASDYIRQSHSIDVERGVDAGGDSLLPEGR
jgi:hypothetical protein